MTTSPTVLAGLHKIALPLTGARLDMDDVNAYLAEGDPLTLIDCGIATDMAHQVLADDLAALGYRVADIRRLVITHHHVDHRGLARRIVDESGAEVWAHPYTAPWMESPAEAREEHNRFTAAIFHEGGVPGRQIEIMNRVGEYLGILGGESVHVEALIGEGDTLEMHGCRWRVYHTPGHAGGMLCFYQPEVRVLLASDHLLRDISSNPLLESPADGDHERPKRLLDYIREMQRIAALDVEIAYSGHGREITDVRNLVESRLDFHRQRADKLYALFEGQPRTLYELTQLMFPAVPDTHQYLTLSEVLGHLDILERDGRIAPEKRNGRVYWRATPKK
jgi:glyoxylase-like metal-dependent hydrolase (beta-lactamase superfamily II)